MVRALPVVGLLAFLIGCGGEPVREDRAIDWSPGGDAVAFQNDQEGVFVADKAGAGLTRIFEPDASVLATSRPLHCPIDGRLIFTTAHDPQGAPRSIDNPGAGLPEGNIAFQRPVNYTCWIRDEAADGSQPKPRTLFRASCEHIGYVSAGLAVRWHPDGQRILFVDVGEFGDHRHSVYEFDLRTQNIRSVFPHRADAVIIDFTPRGSHLVCVAGFAGNQADGAQVRADVAGIWLGNPDDGKSWWRVAGTGPMAAGELPSLIESLRASRPAWTADDQQFASVASDPKLQPDQPVRSLLQVTNVATRETRTVHQAEGLFADLHWSRDAKTLGFIERRSEGESALRIYDSAGVVSDPINSRPVRKFAGFDNTGARLAYVAADETGLPQPEQEWTFVLPPDRLARDTVIVSEIGDAAHGQEVFAGMRVTFPVWSPTENRLSLWMTFAPRYRSLFSILFHWGLWPGDPAATLDLSTGDVSWMAVSATEELQVGHYYLLKKDYERAWQWFERANAKLPARRAPRDLQEFVQTIGAPERSLLFESHCLRQLGRDAEAAKKLSEFDETFFPAPQGAPDPAARFLDDLLLQFGSQAEFLKRLLHDLYVAEVFLSIDAPEAGITFLREQHTNEQDSVHRLSSALALSQVLLAAGRREEYLSVCSRQVLPLAWEMWNADDAAKAAVAGPGRAGNTSPGNSGPMRNFVLPIVGGLSLLPLAYPEFLAGIPDVALQEALATWEEQRPQIADDLPALAVDLFLRAAHRTLGNVEQAREDEARIAANAATKSTLGDKDLDAALRELRTSVRKFAAGR